MTIERAREKLLSAILSGSTVRDMVELSADILGSPLRFTSFQRPETSILSQNYPYDDFLIWKNFLMPKGKKTDIYLNFLSESYGLMRGEAPYFAPYSKELKRRRLVCMAYVGNQRIGHLSIPEVTLPLEAIDQEQMTLCAKCVAIVCIQDKNAQSIQNSASAMKMLISENHITHAQLAAIAGDQAFPQVGDYQLLALRLCSNLAHESFDLVCNRLTSLLQSDWITCTGTHAIILYKHKRFSSETLDLLKKLLEENHCSGCFSPLFHDLMQTPLWYKRIFALLPFINGKRGDLIDYIDWLDHGLYYETGLSPAQLASFIDPRVQILDEYDKLHHTEYIRTLDTYFAYSLNQRKTANALQLHINTVTHRMQRIIDISGIDLNHPCVSVSIMQSLRLLQYIRAKATDT